MSSGNETGPISINPFMYGLVRFVTGIPMRLGGGLTVIGEEHIPKHGRVIVAGNHFTNLDPFVIAHALPNERRIQYMAKKELFVNPVLGYVIRSGGSFPVDRGGSDVGAIRKALRILQAEGMLGIFPEGTRGGEKIHTGVAVLALKGNAPIIPAGISKGKKGWRVHFGAPILPEGDIKEITAQVGAALEKLRLYS